MSQKQTSREDGAVAVMTALMVLLMLSVGALAVDLGNAMTRKRDTQSQADFATLAGAGIDNGLPAASTSTSATDPAIEAAASYLYKNQPQNDSTAARRTALEAGQRPGGPQPGERRGLLRRLRDPPTR